MDQSCEPLRGHQFMTLVSATAAIGLLDSRVAFHGAVSHSEPTLK